MNRFRVYLVYAPGVDFSSHVRGYDSLRDRINECGSPEYQKEYRSFWAMNVARLPKEFYDGYSKLLSQGVRTGVTPGNIAMELLSHPGSAHEQPRLQYSFASKLLHMLDPSQPIYDSKVAAFYFYIPPNVKSPDQKAINLDEFHSFLTLEYQRILRDGLLHDAIKLFRQVYEPVWFTDEKIIDSLIWAFVDTLNKWPSIERGIMYE